MMRTIILTGATGGLGKSLVEVLTGKNNLDLVCVYRNQKKFEEISKSISSIHGYRMKSNDDFSDLYNYIDTMKTDSIVLILNAFAISPIKRIGNYSKFEVEEFISGNIISNVLLLNTTIDFCHKNKIGLRIINLDSGAADFPLTGWGNYCAAKAYMNSFISVIAVENPEYEIVSFDPGVMNTNMQAEIRATDREIFDQVDTFKKYKEENSLRNPTDVAKYISNNYIDFWNSKNMREKIK